MRQDINMSLYAQKTPNILPSRASYLIMGCLLRGFGRKWTTLFRPVLNTIFRYWADEICWNQCHYDDVIMDTIASQITSLTIVYSALYLGADQCKHQSSASLAFVWRIHRGPVNSPHKWPVTRKMSSFDDVIMVVGTELSVSLRVCNVPDDAVATQVSRGRFYWHGLAWISAYSISQEICTRFCCALLCCGYAIVHNEFTWSIYPYSSGLLCWHWGNR